MTEPASDQPTPEPPPAEPPPAALPEASAVTAAPAAAVAAPEGEAAFAALDLAAPLLRALEELGYEQPTPIQARAIPPLLAGRDLFGQAQTGTGKTAAFALPLLHRLDPDVDAVQAIVLVPTRELALQVSESVRAYGRHLGERGVQVLPIYGGQPIRIQLGALRRGVDVVIGTPGRVRDHLERGTLDLGGVRFFGLDEADEMLKMGFIEDVEWILEHAPAQRQVALFSATLPGPIRRVAERYLRDPADVRVEHKTLTVPSVTQLAARVLAREKGEALERVLENEDYEAVLVFVRTQRTCAELTERLQAHGHRAESVHGGMSQPQREAVVARLRKRRVQIVVATDVAARGLDVEHIDLVVNYDMPLDEEVYVHRIGRTGRAGREGRAISFWEPRERRLVQSIERYAGKRMEPMRVPGRAELLDRRRERLLERVRELAGGEQDELLELASGLVSEGLDPTHVAAAALRIAWGEGPLALEPEPEPEPRFERRPPREREGAPPAREGEVELVLSVGHVDRVRPGDIVGAVAGESGLPGSVVGSIRILERVCFVRVAGEHADAIVEALGRTTIRGRPARPRLAHPGGDAGAGHAPAERRGPPRARRDERDYGDRRRGPSRPRRDERDSGDRRGPPRGEGPRDERDYGDRRGPPRVRHRGAPGGPKRGPGGFQRRGPGGPRRGPGGFPKRGPGGGERSGPE